MNGLIASIITGVVVTVIGAFAAYYFGVRQERLRQAYEREKEARTRQEEKQREEQNQREEQQRELNKQRAEAFNELQARVYSIMGSLIDFCETVVLLRTKAPTKDAIKLYSGVEKAWRPYFEHMLTMVVKASELMNELTSLQDYYQAHESYLRPSTRELFHSFDNEILDYEILSGAHVATDALYESHPGADDEAEPLEGDVWAVQRLLELLDEIEEQHTREDEERFGRALVSVSSFFG